MPEHKGRLEGKVAIVTGAGSSGPGVGNGNAGKHMRDGVHWAYRTFLIKPR